jgi:hypothetical protein
MNHHAKVLDAGVYLEEIREASQRGIRRIAGVSYVEYQFDLNKSQVAGSRRV